MKILFAVHEFFPKYYTGTERLTLNLSKQMQRMGHSVLVLTYGYDDENEGYCAEGNCLLKEYEFEGVPVVSIKLKVPRDDVSFTIFNPDIEKIADKIISENGCDIVHVVHPMRVGSVIRVARQKNIPVVLTPTDFWLMCPKGIAITQKGELCQSSENGVRCIKECYGDVWKDRLLKRASDVKEVFVSVDCVVSATKFLSQIFKNDGVTSPIRIIGFGADHNHLKHNSKTYSRDSQITLGFLGTLQRHKGAQILLEAYNLAKMDNINLRIYGDYFGQDDYFKNLAKMVHDPQKVAFLGSYKYEQMPDILNEIDVVVVPSLWWENSPLVLLRSLANSVPAIVSDLGGLTEIVKDGQNGFSFEAGDARALSAIIRRIGENPSILSEIKSRIIRPPRIGETAFEYEKIYLGLVGKN